MLAAREGPDELVGAAASGIGGVAVSGSGNSTGSSAGINDEFDRATAVAEGASAGPPLEPLKCTSATIRINSSINPPPPAARPMMSPLFAPAGAGPSC